MLNSRTKFFENIKKKYDMSLSRTLPCVIRFDARAITRDLEIDLLDESEGSFSWALQQVCKIMSEKNKDMLYYCGSDELNILIFDPNYLTLNFDKLHTNTVVSIAGQYIFHLFEKYYKKPVFFKGTCFSLYPDNMYSYLLNRKHANANTLIIYYLKSKGLWNKDIIGKNFNAMCVYAKENIAGFDKRTEYQRNGIVFLGGHSVSVESVLDEHKKEKSIQEKKEPVNARYTKSVSTKKIVVALL